MIGKISLFNGDVKEITAQMDDNSVHCMITSPPYYGLRIYDVPDVEWGGWNGQLGMEPTPNGFVQHMGEIFDEGRRILHPEGVLFLNIGDSAAASGGSGSGEYALRHKQFGKVIAPGTRQPPRRAPAGFKNKDLLGIPYRCAMELQRRGWYWREVIIWHKPNPRPESHKDRPTRAFEPIFMFTKSEKYYFNKPDKLTNVWTFKTKGYRGAHFATFPPELPQKCIEIACPDDGIVFDPFAGSGTTLLTASKMGYDSIGIELSTMYCGLIEQRIHEELGMFAEYEVI
jgi:site-specific DNA-methyltransferase (adenine-specific)